MENIRALFWDVDDTVLDFVGYVKQTMETGFPLFGAGRYEPWMYDVFHEVNGEIWRGLERGEYDMQWITLHRWDRVFEALGVKADGAEFEDYFRKGIFESGLLIDGAAETLTLLSGYFPMYVASNGPAGQQENRLTKAGIRGLFRGVFTSGGLGASKPSKAFFDRCFERTVLPDGSRVLPENVLMIGDSLTSDMAGAVEYGLKTCLYDPAGKHTECGLPIDLRVRDLREIPALLGISPES